MGQLRLHRYPIFVTTLALIISNPAQIPEKLNQLMSAQLRETYAKSALLAAKNNHDLYANSKRLYGVIEDCCVSSYEQK